MKKAVLFLVVSVLMLMISCGDDQPTKVNENEKVFFEYADFLRSDRCYN